MNRKLSGFTLIELLVTITIIGVLSTMAVSTFKGHFSKAKDSVVIDMVSRLVKKIKIKAILQGGTASILTLDGVNYSNIKIVDILNDELAKLPKANICHGAGQGKFFVSGKLLSKDEFFVKGSPVGVSEFDSLTETQKENCDLSSLSDYLLEENIVFNDDGNMELNSTVNVQVNWPTMTFSVNGEYAYLAWIRITNSSGGSIQNIQWRTNNHSNPWILNSWATYLSGLSSGDSYTVKVDMFDYIPDPEGSSTLANGEIVRVEVFEAFNGSFVVP